MKDGCRAHFTSTPQFYYFHPNKVVNIKTFIYEYDLYENMTNVGIVGYRHLINIADFDDLVISLPRELDGELGLRYVSRVTLDDAVNNHGLEDKYIAQQSAEKLLESRPDVVHMANFRDPSTGRDVDKMLLYILKQEVPILLTTGGGYGIDYARCNNIPYITTPFRLHAYADKLHKLAEAYHS